MISTPTRRTLVALATTVALLPAAPALAQTPTPTPTVTATATPTTPAPIAPQTQVDKTLIDYGDTHLLTVTGRAGATARLFANGRQIRAATIPASGQFTWKLQPGDRTLFYAKVDGQQTNSATVEVRRTVTIGVSEANGVYTFTGRIARAEPFVQVTIARLDSVTKRVTGVASTSTQADGSYTIRTRLPGGFAGYYALTGVNRSLLQPGRSRLYGINVPTTPPPAAKSLSLDVRRAGTSYAFEGQLMPARGGVPVTLAQIVNGRLVGVAGGITEANGRYIITIQPPPGTHFYTALTADARSRNYGLVVPQPVAPACSATSIRKSYDDSAQCMFRAYKRGDWAAVANYALPPVIAALREWRPYDVRTGFKWGYFGCGKPQYEDIGDFPPASSGVACEFYSYPTPGDGAIHGVTIEFNMDRYFRAESYTTVG